MVNNIEIKFVIGLKEYDCYIDVNNLFINKNGVARPINKKNISKVLQYLVNWKSEYFNSKEIDGEEFSVLINTNEGREQFHGKGAFPDNYENFKKFIGEL